MKQVKVIQLAIRQRQEMIQPTMVTRRSSDTCTSDIWWSENSVSLLVIWAQSTTKDHIRAEEDSFIIVERTSKAEL